MRDLFVYNKLHSSFMNCLTSSWYNWENRQEMNLNWILSCFQNLENNKDSISNSKDYKGLEYNWYRTSHRRCSIKKGVLKNFTKFTGKHLCQSLFFNKVAGLRQAWGRHLQAWEHLRVIVSVIGRNINETSENVYDLL